MGYILDSDSEIGSTSTLTISQVVINPTSTTSVEISAYTDQMTDTPTSFSVDYVELVSLKGSTTGSISTESFSYVSD